MVETRKPLAVMIPADAPIIQLRQASRRAIDFHAVEPAHIVIHERLQNWARWCYSTGGRTVQPMFRLYRSSEQWGSPEPSTVVDTLDAQHVQKAVSGLPQGHRKALAWCYVLRNNPRRMARELAVTLEALAELVREGRVMLINRSV